MKNEIIDNQEFVFGRNPVLEALKSGQSINKILIAKGLHGIEKIIDYARQKKVLFQFVERSAIDKVCRENNHQGVLAYISPKRYVEVEEILAVAEAKGEPPFILLLDSIEDPHNLGAILRTADAAGVHGVIIPKRRSVPLTSTVTKASSGAVFYVPVARVSNLNDAIYKLKDNRVWIVGLDSLAEQEFTKADLKLSLGLVVGSEGKGLSRLVRENCDFLVKVPMKGEISSLNASVSAAIAMYEVVRQRWG
ncbi:23S rRNA (guanosine(2251)-2'-O)-methyltransferase RlmB [candidate division WOR-1 bacterium RIFOXYD2_FULL_36_8]|uniref:23S rRNA (Guanosine(2251)-2'-O)-methyltransferase RlmB n=1 Tax=candidate division WOR-1 bacterium RIFOXYB2_FULL_36_35 TaxID=1802578 RepID=A0A1F4RYV6_UNCSA|nr:MAG: 23S rRNA (guanosine(2251)-2'-O)-methyltransferase RlmB [candidate division WOR-1 bacterium RIFOXYA2_FULL_36_21]OGC13339.1 MAG: 23S rRNA (guanosine(2251)-2'-O)-methyltransferase RlmB [candidate division WOR-1 bacterium RIFOXYB2_FULL_36_35]OGC21046.1 MAG: 23S rRNA (guanosine(2251)-2'-O)-methyltransferase RlmB [candidate division WOR-1 bacterium RIFOXYA12_FULL_36_13]OGC38867.1 MAG: 23S rRNA (guanosine(2251)-2'-O)-methyltransferase RlmB [candidate division WOR-1 bacterium RIFOXYD2_FULL_36_8]